jgi:flagellar hook-length control protein FliK
MELPAATEPRISPEAAPEAKPEIMPETDIEIPAGHQAELVQELPVAPVRTYQRHLATGNAVPQETAQRAAVAARAEVVRRAAMVRSPGRSEMTLLLSPPDMGRVKVHLEAAEGRVSIRLEVENPQVRETLRQEMPLLARGMREAELDLGRCEVSDYDSNAGDRRPPQAPRSAGRPGTATAESLAEQDNTLGREWTRITHTGNVDCLV